MKVFLISVLFGLTLATVQAAVVVNISIDEFGNGTHDKGSPGVPQGMPGALGTDPSTSNGLGVNVLRFLLPFAVTNGELVMTEPGGGVSEIIRFITNTGTSTWIVFYSDNLDGVDAPADTGLPVGSPFTNIVTLAETGPEGSNGLLYVPAAGQPGYISSDFTATYNIVSDSTATPEPASFALIGVGLIGLGLARRGKKN